MGSVRSFGLPKRLQTLQLKPANPDLGCESIRNFLSHFYSPNCTHSLKRTYRLASGKQKNCLFTFFGTCSVPRFCRFKCFSLFACNKEFYFSFYLLTSTKWIGSESCFGHLVWLCIQSSFPVSRESVCSKWSEATLAPAANRIWSDCGSKSADYSPRIARF